MASKSDSYEKNFKKSQRKRQLQKNKSHKRNRDTKKSRRKNWMDYTDAPDEVETFERIMPLDETDRRKAVEQTVAAKTAAEAEESADFEASPESDATTGRVIEVSSGLCRVVMDESGETRLCTLRGSLSAAETGFTNVIAVGDRVQISETEPGKGVVEDVLPRRNHLSRPDPFYSHLQQTLVANVDQLLIVAAWRQPNIWTELIDRYLITAARNQVEALICVNKIDLAENVDEVEMTLAPYHAHPVILTSATDGDGIDHLRGLLDGKITVLAGLSGVGKSSLLTAVQPDFDLRTGAVNTDWGQGRHTTTQSNMLPFGDGGYVIDTPGIREFGLYGLHQSELVTFYPEFVDLAHRCRFADCTHLHEPGCAVREAVDGGTVSAQRYHNYQKIRETLPE